MCGIAGIINFTKDISKDIKPLENMTKTLSKRGPDDTGYYYSKNANLGHKRLIVVDPKGGKQPMIKKFENNEYILVYNGELYNTKELRKDLISKGFTFNSYSDTEVLLTSYICYGLKFMNKLNGIFAFAIFDKNKKQILLVRDPLGVKPLFYALRNDTLIFGSEIKTLLAHPLVDPVLNRDGLTELFSLGPAVNPGSAVFKDIYEIKPGNFLIYTPNLFQIKEYWNITAEENKEDIQTSIEHTRYLLTDAIKRQLVSDVPLCTFLSGGLDSSAISAIAADEYKRNNKILTTYSIDYEDNYKYFKSSFFQPDSDEYWAIKMSKYINSNHLTVTLNHEDLVNSLKEAVIARDLPGMADVDSSLYLFCKYIRKKFVVALSGECADEIFGGYPWFTAPEMKYADTFPWSRFIDNRISILNDDYKSLKIHDFTQQCYKDTLKEVPHLDGESYEEYRMKELFYLNIKWFMMTLLNRKDRMSMASSLEVRVPFADHRIVQYAFNIPASIKLLKGREKGLLRASLKGILPEDIVYRKKSPYPKTHNPIYTDLICTAMNNILNDNNSPILNIIDKTRVKEIVETKGSSYKTPWYGQLMTGPQLLAYLIQLNIWLKDYKINLI